VERNRKAGQNPPRVVAPIEEEEVTQTPKLSLTLSHTPSILYAHKTEASNLTSHRSPITNIPVKPLSCTSHSTNGECWQLGSTDYVSSVMC